jgi:hypothetical protein
MNVWRHPDYMNVMVYYYHDGATITATYFAIVPTGQTSVTVAMQAEINIAKVFSTQAEVNECWNAIHKDLPEYALGCPEGRTMEWLFGGATVCFTRKGLITTVTDVKRAG